MIFAFGAGLVAFASVVLWRRPERLLLVWLFSLLSVPYWLGASLFGIFVPASQAVTLVLSVIAVASFAKFKLGIVDLLVAGFTGFTLVACIFSHSSFAFALSVLIPCLGGYALGRGVAAGITRSLDNYIVGFGLVGGLLAIIEVLLDFHPFLNVGRGMPSYELWGLIQYRGEQARSEWSFGHSIAFGNMLAITLPFVLQRIRQERARYTVIATIIVAGVVCTLARSAMVACLVTIALVFVFRNPDAPKHPLRAIIVAISVPLGAIACYVLLGRLDSADSQASSNARLTQLGLLSEIEPLGPSGSFLRLADGSPVFLLLGGNGGTFTRTVDNTFLWIGLQLGASAALTLGFIFLVFLTDQFRRLGRTPSGIAVSGQFLTILTVALITQYAMFLLFAIGIAATARNQYSGARESEDAALSVPVG